MEISTYTPKVSVILPVYNRKDLVKKAIDSVQNQTYKNFELIIVDDGSSDGSSDYLLSLVNEFTRYTKHSNRSTALSLNTGIQLSCGEYITFIDSDDEYKPEHIESRIKYFLANPEVELIHSSAQLVGDSDEFLVPDKYDQSKLIHINDCILGATIFGLRNIFLTLGGFSNVYSYDSEFIERAEKSFNVRKIESDTYIYYRNSSDSVLTKLKNKQNAG